ncbi:hypothetical protein [Streptomyces sp. NPDC054958]
MCRRPPATRYHGGYGIAGGPTSPTALAAFAFALALALIATLTVTTATLPARPGADRARSIALWLSAGRLALPVSATATFVAYGVLTVEL